MQRMFGGGVLELLQGDLTEQAVDAVVNAANTRLAGGGAVQEAPKWQILIPKWYGVPFYKQSSHL